MCFRVPLLPWAAQMVNLDNNIGNSVKNVNRS